MNSLILLPTQSLVITGAANTVSATAHYADYSPSGQLTPSNQLTALTSGSEQVICNAPASPDKRLIKSLSVVNPTGGSLTITIGIKAGSTVYGVQTATIAAGATFSF